MNGQARPEGQLVRPLLLVSFTLEVLRGQSGVQSQHSQSPPPGCNQSEDPWGSDPEGGWETFREQRSACPTRFPLWVARPVWCPSAWEAEEKGSAKNASGPGGGLRGGSPGKEEGTLRHKGGALYPTQPACLPACRGWSQWAQRGQERKASLQEPLRPRKSRCSCHAPACSGTLCPDAVPMATTIPRLPL